MHDKKEIIGANENKINYIFFTYILKHYINNLIVQ